MYASMHFLMGVGTGGGGAWPPHFLDWGGQRCFLATPLFDAFKNSIKERKPSDFVWSVLSREIKNGNRETVIHLFAVNLGASARCLEIVHSISTIRHSARLFGTIAPYSA